MKIEFHYYITHLIAARAGFRGNDLRILAYASQFTDDNDKVYVVNKHQANRYQNRISQTLNPLKGHRARLEVYPLFHFIPGDPNAESAKRKDRNRSPFVTTPDSPNANRIIDEAIRTGNLYQIGIASHAYADTWAHQNFVGYKSGFNAFSGMFNWLVPDSLIPNIGHADAGTCPDQPRLTWDDERTTGEPLNNRENFLDAAGCLFNKFRMMADSTCSSESLDADRESLQKDIADIMDGSVDDEDLGEERISRYSELATTKAYGEVVIDKYKPDGWFNVVVRTQHLRRGVAGKGIGKRRELFHFRKNYQHSDWFKFQEAVESYAEMAKTVLCETPAIAKAYGR